MLVEKGQISVQIDESRRLRCGNGEKQPSFLISSHNNQIDAVETSEQLSDFCWSAWSSSTRQQTRVFHLLQMGCFSCAAPRVCETGALHSSANCCWNKRDSRGFRHRGDQLKQAPPISAGKARCHAAHSQTKPAASQIQPCKSLMAEKWS